MRVVARLLLTAALTAAVSCSGAHPKTEGEPEHQSAGSIPGTAGQAADDDAECRGPGRYESGKEGSYRPCCEGLTEVSYRKASWTGENGKVPVCTQPPLRVYGCVRGVCGDGMCEEGEAPACGCLLDCPEAAWDTPEKVAPIAGLSHAPLSCSASDLTSSMLGSMTRSTDCGALRLGATPEAQAGVAGCARAAYARGESFQLFWYAQGGDGVKQEGRIGRREENGTVTVYAFTVDSKVNATNLPGATASWWPCTLSPGSTCSGGIDACFKCAEPTIQHACGCLPEGPRPNAPDGFRLELRCR